MNVSEFEAIKVLVESTLFISFLVGLFLAYILFSLIDSIVRRINIPKRVRTESGYLYRHKNIYVTKDRHQELKREFLIKHKAHILRIIDSKL